MNILDKIKSSITYFDGGTGTVLQSSGLKAGELPELWNITHPEKIIELHKSYLQAGCDIIKTNTFGANRLKFEEKFEDIILAAVKNAQEAVKGYNDKYIALDIGPLGKMLKPLGELDFEEAVSFFADIVKVGVNNGVDLILIETMNDSYETKAAVLAAKENSNLPVFVTNVYDETGKLMTGATPAAMIAMLEGLGVDAVGMNCSLGPKEMEKLLPEFVKYSSLPIIVNPNAGLPEIKGSQTVYNINSQEFSDIVFKMANIGATVLGGCCGTTPEYIKKVVEKTAKVKPRMLEDKKYTMVSSYTHMVDFGSVPRLIGERINPTGKKHLKEALKNNDIRYILNEALGQAEKKVHLLDVNVGLPEINEAEMMLKVIPEIQSVTDLPLQIDSADPATLEKALRIYNGKPLINSVSGKEESMKAVFPLAAKYGGVVIALTLDENGIPNTAQGRLEIAKKIINCASKYGIKPKDIIVDPLTLTVSADPKAALVTLESIALIKERLGVCTSLGVSNVSFGLPNRDLITSSFFSMALAKGLDAAIMNPYSAEVMKAYYSSCALVEKDTDCMLYINFVDEFESKGTVVDAKITADNKGTYTLKQAIVRGLRESVKELTLKELKTNDAMSIINQQIIPALNEVGIGFENKKMYLPQLLISADAASMAFDVIKENMKCMKLEQTNRGLIVLATVKGDIHDIGKNIVKVLLENYGFMVIDLGRDVDSQKIIETVKEYKASLVGLSALMTTTVGSMEETIKQLNRQVPWCKTVVGAAVLTQEYADKIGADFYAKDAMATVRFAEKFFN